MTHRFVRSLTLVGLFYAIFGAAFANSQGATQDPDTLRSAFTSFLAAQQDAVNSGDPDRILKSSSPVAVASLALLNSLDLRDQQDRKALGALPYAEGLLSDLDSEMMLLRMELSLGETAHAAELKKHILSTNTDNAELHAALAGILEQGSELDDAVREAQRAVELDPGSRDAQVALGMAYWGLNVFQYNEETLHAFTAAHQLDPDGFSTNLLLGSIESQYHRFEDAAQHLRAASAADPSAPEPWYQLGMNANEQDRPAEAGELLKRYLSLAEAKKEGKPRQLRIALLTLDQIAEEQGKTPDPAQRTQEDALKQQILKISSANDPGSNASTGTLPMGAPDTSDRSPLSDKARPPSAATATIEQLRELAASALANIGTVLARRQDYAAAVVPFKYAAEEDPTLGPVMRNLGFAACISASYEECAQALKQVVAAHPEDAAAREYLGMAEFETGQYADAATTFSSLGAALSSNPVFEATAAAAFARAGDRDRAQQALAELKSASPDPQLQAREAVAYLDLGDVARATASAQAAQSGSAQAPAEALRVLGQLELERRNASGAVTELQNECKAEHEGAAAQLECQALLAEALIESGKKSEGEDLSAKLVRANPNLVSTLLEQGELLRKNGDVHAAYGKFAAAHALAPREKQVREGFDSAQRALHSSTH